MVEYTLLSGISSSTDDEVDDEKDEGEFVLVFEELDHNSTISTSVCKASDIPLGASGLTGASDVPAFPSLASSDPTRAKTSASDVASSCTTSAASITC